MGIYPLYKAALFQTLCLVDVNSCRRRLDCVRVDSIAPCESLTIESVKALEGIYTCTVIMNMNNNMLKICCLVLSQIDERNMSLTQVRKLQSLACSVLLANLTFY